MKTFTPKTFNIPELKGISTKTIEEHVKLYQGYVKHANLIIEKIAELGADAEKNAYAISEVQRRFGFEFDGMKNHEYYFEQFEGGANQNLNELKTAIEEEWGSFDAWLARFKAVAMTRGIGWAILSYDKTNDRLVNSWIDEQHLGQLNSVNIILALDMWEHSFLFDYVPGDKIKYVDAFFENINWEVVEKRFVEAGK
ncbi:MAG: Fe-Mn family superoxide dismutase [Candidatus Paceibacterota bacterium]|jgi:Fe-Mn family superoxide dismutase